jgi:hypothetical protein
MQLKTTYERDNLVRYNALQHMDKVFAWCSRLDQASAPAAWFQKSMETLGARDAAGSYGCGAGDGALRMRELTQSTWRLIELEWSAGSRGHNACRQSREGKYL